MARNKRLFILVGVIVAFLLALALLPVHAWMATFIEWVRGAGWVGVLGYGIIYIVACVLFIPASLLTLGAGFIYGPIYGTLLVSPASVIGATISFLLARTLAREWVGSKIAGNARFAAIDGAVGRQGWKIVGLLRLSPIFPFNLLNYALGLTRVSLPAFVLASFVGMLPATFMYVYLGSIVTSVADLASGAPSEGGWAQTALLWGGLAATVVVTVFITRIAQKALREAMQDQEEPSGSEVGREATAS